jgi:predicted DNA repair protein MutK
VATSLLALLDDIATVLDDVGLYLSRGKNGAVLGRFILSAAPILMKTLSVLGTAAMFLVGGGILTHGLPGTHGSFPAVVQMALDALAGVIAGALALGVVKVSESVFPRAERH